MCTNVTKTIIEKRRKNGLLLNREILTLINLKILITYSGTVAIKITFAQNLHKVDYQIKKTSVY